MSFMIDQFLHIVILYVISCRYSFSGTLPLEYIDIHGDVSAPAFLIAVLFLMKPVNILIKLVLERYKIGEADSCKDIKNAGALIGNLERLLTLVFVLMAKPVIRKIRTTGSSLSRKCMKKLILND